MTSRKSFSTYGVWTKCPRVFVTLSLWTCNLSAIFSAGTESVNARGTWGRDRALESEVLLFQLWKQRSCCFSSVPTSWANLSRLFYFSGFGSQLPSLQWRWRYQPENCWDSVCENWTHNWVRERITSSQGSASYQGSYMDESPNAPHPSVDFRRHGQVDQSIIS